MAGTSGVPIKEEAWILFLATLAVCGNVTAAANKADFTRMAAYKRRKDDEAFAQAWNEAAKLGARGLEDEARRRAFNGWDEPVFYQGDHVDFVAKFSDTLLIFLLKGLYPEKYKDRQATEHSGEVGLTHSFDLSQLDPKELRVLERILTKASAEAES